LTVAEAAELLGVSASTLRNWDRAGKLKASRHPVNGYLRLKLGSRTFIATALWRARLKKF